MTVYNPFDFFIEEEAETFPFQYPEDIRDDLKIYMQPEPMSPALADYVASIDLTPLRTIDFIVGLNARLQQKVNYVIRMEPGVQTPEQTLQLALGPAAIRAGCSCRSCAISASPPASSPAISSSWRPTSRRSMARPVPRSISPTCTPGARSISPAPAGSGSIRPPAC